MAVKKRQSEKQKNDPSPSATASSNGRKTERAQVLAHRAHLTAEPSTDAVLAGFKHLDLACKDWFARVAFEDATVYQDGMMTALALAKQEGRRELAKEVLAYVLYEPDKETETEGSLNRGS